MMITEKKVIYRNSTCPIVTPQDIEQIRKVIRHAVERGEGANRLLVLGTTGEDEAFSVDQCKRITDIAVDEVRRLREEIAAKDALADHDRTKMHTMFHITGKRLELAIGVSRIDFDETVELARYVHEAGADYAVLMPVYITRRNAHCTRRGSTDSALEVVRQADRTLFWMYNAPFRTDGKNWPTHSWKELAEEQRVLGLKDSSGDPIRYMHYVEAAHGNADVDIGSEVLGLEIPAIGVVSGSSNVLAPAWRAAVQRDYTEDIRGAYLAGILAGFQKVYAINPIGAFMYMLHKLEIISSPDTNLPRNNADDDLRRGLDALMMTSDFKKIYACGR